MKFARQGTSFRPYLGRLTQMLASLALIIAVPVTAQTEPTMVTLNTGSAVATWTLPGEGPIRHTTPVLFLHGGPGLYTEARRLDEGKLLRAAGFTTVYFDQAGGGKSARLAASSYSLDRAVADVEALRVAIGTECLILWGNSFGASLAAAYTARFPDRVAGFILTSPGMFPGFDGKRDYSRTNRDKVEYSKALSSAINRIDRDGATAEAQLSQGETSALFDELVASELIEAVVCKGSGVIPPALPGGGNLFAQRLLSRDVKRARLAPSAGTTAPALIIRGNCDFLPLASAERYRAYLGGTIVTIEGTGHGLLENRAAIDAAIARFAATELAKLP
jgi:pimeloyl-ACP methyl ester carboxylesterase